MARPIITFEFNNKSESKFTNYQKLLFRYMVGSLALEDGTMFKNGCLHIVTNYDKRVKFLKMQFNGASDGLVRQLVNSFPMVMTDIPQLGSSTIMVKDYEFQLKTETIRTISVTI